MKKSILLIILFCSSSILASEFSCPDINLLESNSCVSKLGIRNQGRVGNCYAQAAAQVVDCYLYENDQIDLNEHLTSPLMTSILSTDSQKMRELLGMHDSVDFGYFCQAVRTINKNGSCNYKEIEGRFGFQEDIYTFLSNIFEEKEKLSTLEQYEEVVSYLSRRTRAAADFSFGQFQEWMGEKNYVNFLKGFFGHYCEGNTFQRNDKIKCKNHISYLKRDKKIASKITAQLEKKVPVGISLNNCFLRAGHNWKKECGTLRKFGHVVTLVGSRKRNDQCQYLIKDSFGASPSSHHTDWEKVAEIGGLWVDAEALFKSSISFSTLE